MTKPTVSIRNVMPADVPAVVNLIAEVLAEFGLTFGKGSHTDSEVALLPGSYVDRGGAFWVATDASHKIIGTCGICPIDKNTVELRKMYIAPSSRGQGIANLLFKECLTFARGKEAQWMVLDTIHEMNNAIAFYEKVGFVRDDNQIRGARCSRGYRLDL